MGFSAVYSGVVCCGYLFTNYVNIDLDGDVSPAILSNMSSKNNMITTTINSGETWYTFTANSTKYEVQAHVEGYYTVYSNQVNRRSDTVIKQYDDLAALAQRSKAFAQLATLIG